MNAQTRKRACMIRNFRALVGIDSRIVFARGHDSKPARSQQRAKFHA